MQFINHTPFPALAFGGVDQKEQSFHVVVLRQTFTWNEAGELVFVEEQQPLCEADEYFDDDLQGSVRQESDLCAYKPRCDVIVNATAYPPQTTSGKAPSRFNVRVMVKRPDTPAPLPPEPRGLNPFMAAPPEEMAAWRSAVESAKNTMIPGERLIDKTLSVTGERQFIRRMAPLRLIGTFIKIGTLGIVPLPAWRLTKPKRANAVPMRLEQSYGGQCRIDADSKAARKVRKKYRLTTEQAAAHPDVPHPPVAHEALTANPVGRGFTRNWYLNATHTSRLPAPLIEHPFHPITRKIFDRTRTGKAEDASTAVVGLGIRPKGHPDRSRLVGTIDAKFIEGSAPLPEDFDFAVWNAAWPDQQIDTLQGNEVIELTNLCRPETAGVQRDHEGNVVLRLRLPGHLPFVLVRFENGSIGELEARLDTVLIDPDQRQISCVWRATLANLEEVRVLEARMLERGDMQAMKRAGIPPQEDKQRELHG